MDRTTDRAAYRTCRDVLVRHRDDYDAAVAAFRWPDISDRFNWALDWFDPIARHNLRTALRIIGEDGTDRSYSFAELAARSDRLAASLTACGVAPGDRVMVMLGNQVELWESMLAVMKLGAVLMPATTALGPKDLADRVGRGAVRHVITNADQVAKLADIPGDFGRIAIGDARTSVAAISAGRRGGAGITACHPHPRGRPDAGLLHVRHHQPAETRRAHAPLLPSRAFVDDVLPWTTSR